MQEQIRGAYNKLGMYVKYRVFNNQIQIDMNSIIKRIGEIEELHFAMNEPIRFHSFIHKGKSISSNIFSVRMGTGVTRIRTNVLVGNAKPDVKDGDVIRNQKIAFDTVRPDRWNEKSFVQYFDNLHSLTYGIGNIEIASNLHKLGSKSPISKIKILLGKFTVLGLDRNSVKEYMDWVFANKAKKFTVSLGFLISDNCIQEWVNLNLKKDRKKEADEEWDYL